MILNMITPKYVYTNRAVSNLETLRHALLSLPYVNVCKIYENDSNESDEHGIPPHSFCVVISGGVTTTIANTIFQHKAPGIGTYGAVSKDIIDSSGISHTIKYQRAQQTAAAITLELTPLEGFDSSIVQTIKQAIVKDSANYDIGQDIELSHVRDLILSYTTENNPTFSISLLTATAQGFTTSEVVQAAWNQRFNMPASMVQVTVAT